MKLLGCVVWAQGPAAAATTGSSAQPLHPVRNTGSPEGTENNRLGWQQRVRVLIRTRQQWMVPGASCQGS